MGLSNIWVMDIIGPAVLLILLVCMVIRAPSSRCGQDEEYSDDCSPNFHTGEQVRLRDGIE
jgi:hypothetical protein